MVLHAASCDNDARNDPKRGWEAKGLRNRAGAVVELLTTLDEPEHRRCASRWTAIRSFCLAAAAAASLASCAGQQGTNGSTGAAAYASRQPDATVEMTQIQAAFIGSGGGGTGKLFFNGNVYPFTVGGLGIGGIGAAKLEATGNVYNLKDVSQFPGPYVQGRYGFALGTTSGGQMWLENDKGVVLEPKPSAPA